MVTTAIEKEAKLATKIRHVEHIGDCELHFDPRGASALLRALDSQRRHVNAGDVKPALRKPNTIGARSTPNFEHAARLDFVSTDNKLQLRGGAACVPR